MCVPIRTPDTFMTIKLKLTLKNINNFWKNAESQVMIITIKIKIYL